MRWRLTWIAWLLAASLASAAAAAPAPALTNAPPTSLPEPGPGSAALGLAEADPLDFGAAGAVTGQVADAHVLLPDYTNYLARLRAAGCPEHHLRHIIFSDVVAFFDRLRIRQAVNADFEWWKPDIPTQRQVLVYNATHRGWDNLRARLLGRLLGTNAPEIGRLPPLSAGLNFNLTGPVLGALPVDTYAAVVEICQRSKEQWKDRTAARLLLDPPQDTVDQARLRHQTRLELARVLTPAQLEEFLLRNSHNADALRESLRGFKPAREEFLRIFRALDPIQHQMQMDYGNESALSQRQREEYERQCRRAVQEVLPPERFSAYLLTLDPFWRRAFQDAAPHNLGDEAVRRLGVFYRAQQDKKDQIKQDASLSEQQKAMAVRQVLIEEGKFLSDLVEESRRTTQ